MDMDRIKARLGSRLWLGLGLGLGPGVGLGLVLRNGARTLRLRCRALSKLADVLPVSASKRSKPRQGGIGDGGGEGGGGEGGNGHAEQS
eukprot:scaffold133273_cov71-Phaeocystis_antarctica.AAC.1